MARVSLVHGPHCCTGSPAQSELKQRILAKNTESIFLPLTMMKAHCGLAKSLNFSGFDCLYGLVQQEIVMTTDLGP